MRELTGIKAILLDLDGTLVDSAPDIGAALNQALKQCELPTFDLAISRNWIGKGADILMQRALEASGVEDIELSFTQLKPHFYDSYGKNNGEYSVLYPGIKQGLEYFAQQGKQLACVTNKPSAFSGPLLEQMGIREQFDVVIGGDDVYNKKPDPEMLVLAASRLGVATNECLMVGDSDNDVYAAKAADMPICCVSYGYNQGVDLQALDIDYWVDSLSDLYS